MGLRCIAQLNRVLKVCSVLVAGALMSAQALALPRGVTEVTEVEGITEYRLKNDLTVLLFPDQSKETVTVNVTYKVGSRNESYGETGMAHLLEHLLFKGSKKHKNIPQELSEHGAKPNGTTWIDRTNYFETFTATEENIDWALSLESDRMVNSFIAREDLDSEMTVVRNEFERTENSPFRVLMQNIMQVAYDWHNNGKPTIGARADIENVSIDRLQAFYRKYYQPDNAVLTVAGKFDQEEMLKKIVRTFGKIRKPKRQLPELYTAESAQDGERSVTVRRVGDMKIVAAAYHIPAAYHPDFAAIEVLTQILGDTPRGRLHKQLVEGKHAVGSFAFNFDLQDPGLFFAAAQVEKQGDLKQARDVFINTLENIADTPITADEVDRAKANLMKDFDLAFNSSEHIAIALSEYIGIGDWRLIFLNRDRVEKVSLDDVQRVAKTYLQRNNRTEGYFYPTDKPERVIIPEADPIENMLNGYVGRESVAHGEAFDPSYQNIQARSHLHTLTNGIKVALLPKKTRGESVNLQFVMQFGTEKSLTGNVIATETVGDLLMRGSKQYSREQISDLKDKLKAEIDISGYSDSVSGGAVTTRENIVAVIELLAEVLRNPNFDRAEFDQLVAQQIASLEASRQAPQSIVGQELRKLVSPHEQGHPLYEQSIDERIESFKALKYEDLAAAHQKFYGGESMQIAVVGDFDEKAVLQALKSNFGDWHSKEKYQRINTPYADLKAVDKKIDTPDKENAAMVAVQVLPIGKNNPDSVALDMGAYILGGGFLNSRLATRLRQQEGWSYNASAWLNSSNLEERGELVAFAIFAPQNRDSVKAGLREEVAKLIEGGITQEELDAAKSGILQSSRLSRSENSTLANLWLSNLYLDRSMQWNQEREDKLRDLTVEQVNSALKKYIDPSKMSFVTAADLSKKAE